MLRLLLQPECITFPVPYHPYGTGTGDTALPRINDVCSDEIDLLLGIPIFGNIKKTIHVFDVLLFL